MANINAERAGLEVAEILRNWFDDGGDPSYAEAIALITVALHKHGLLFPECSVPPERRVDRRPALRLVPLDS